MTPFEYMRARNLERISIHFILVNCSYHTHPLHKLHTAGSYLLSVFYARLE